MSDNKIDIGSLFQGLQSQMEVQLSTNREYIHHPGSKGDSLENVWIDWLRKYLPNRYSVDKAMVVDSMGNLSDQIDLVIYDQQYTPFVFTQNGINYIPAEGVYAVFEVKPDLYGSVSIGDRSISYIEYAGRKIESVRRLVRTSAKIIDRGQSWPARSLTQVIGGILASENSYRKAGTIEKHLRSQKGLRSIDIGCVVDYGCFFISYTGRERDEGEELFNRIIQYYL